MRASRQNEIFTIILFLIGGFVGFTGIGFGYLISVGALAWYATRGSKAKGWIGPNLEEMRKELAEIELKLFDYIQSSKLTPEETRRMEARRGELYEGIRQWEIEHQRFGA